MSFTSSGWSTPLSSSATLSSPPSPRFGEKHAATPFDNPRIQASQAVEYLSSRTSSSSVVYVYDVAEQVGFGTLTKEWSKHGDKGVAPVVDLQTRAGAGLSLIGRLSQGTSSESGRGSVLTAYTTPNGLSLMAPAFAHLPSANAASRLVVQVPAVSAVGETLALSPTLSTLSSIWQMLPEGITVILSSTPQQTIDFTAISYGLDNTHVVHLFDHFSSSREVGIGLKEPRVSQPGQPLQKLIQAAGHSFFKYTGDAHAESVIVLLNGPLAVAAEAVVTDLSGVGVVTVNVLRPWDADALLAAIPESVRSVHVVDEVPNRLLQGSLYVDVFSALYGEETTQSVHAHRIVPTQTQELLNSNKAFLHFISSIIPHARDIKVAPSTLRNVLLFGAPRTALSTVPQVVEEFFTQPKGVESRLLTDYDVFSKQGGIFASRLLLSPKSGSKALPIPLALPLDQSRAGHSDFLAVLDQGLLKTHDILKHAKPDSAVLVATPWSAEEFLSNLPAPTATLAYQRNLRLFNIDSQAVAEELTGSPKGSENDAVQNLVVYLAFLRLYLGTSATEAVTLQLAQASFGDAIYGISLLKINARTWANLHSIPLAGEPPADAASSPLKDFEFNAIAVDAQDGDVVVNGARLASWHDAAKHIIFPSVYSDDTPLSDEEYPQDPSLRPEVPDRTFLVTCTVNKRLTPLEYDRNVFHLEFDTSGTGLKYAIGEALGVHGWNDEHDVLEFCDWYGVDPNRLITIPVPGDETKFHTRTVHQALQQQIDLFGKPPKSFYTDLAEFATNKVENYALRFIGSPEGSATFKKLSEKDTVTFADLLRAYPSAKPGIEKLCELVGDIKPRHYSIASAQAVVGDRVDLLVVTVDWMTPGGSPRYGQCTRYLAGLKVGQKVTVSIKPSVMKLPPNPKQPLIMAGLGTGAAPFRAFLQYLALRVEQGEEVGPVYYYFGSRYQAAEYLYGEEIEAWILDGVVTRAGLAFSRDGRKKVYIQHKMLEDSEVLADMLYKREGAFYLCGPTWPVPDVYEALVNALVKYKGLTEAEAGDFLEGLKEEERYVLEV
ncbi:assimilatory sulfite reductase, partial [Coprinopsis sp. MPI-PUGE-AT-0042]